MDMYCHATPFGSLMLCARILAKQSVVRRKGCKVPKVLTNRSILYPWRGTSHVFSMNNANTFGYLLTQIELVASFGESLWLSLYFPINSGVPFMNTVSNFCVAGVVSALSMSASAGVIYSTDFNSYTSGNLNQNAAWIGTGGTWATTGSVNSGQLAMSVVSSPSGSGKAVQGTTEKYLSSGRTKGYLDLGNSGKWTAASAGGNNILRTELDVYVLGGQSMASSFGLMSHKSSSEVAAGLMISNTGQVWTSNSGYALANRTNTSTVVSLNAWHSLKQDWNYLTGETLAYVDGVLVASYTTTNRGSVFASMLFTTTDLASGGSTTNNGYGYFDNLAISAMPVPSPGAVALVGLAGLFAKRRRA